MRIIAGKLRGTQLNPIRNIGLNTNLRPTTDRIRENIFNIILGGRFGDRLQKKRVLELFAGTGVFGIEAISRGAASATLIEKDPAAFKLIQSNIKITNTSEQITAIKSNAIKLGICKTKPFDLIFIDAPYRKNLGKLALERALEKGWLSHNALVVWEDNVVPQIPKEFTPIEEKRYGNTILTFLKAPH